MPPKNVTTSKKEELTEEVRKIRRENPANMICADCPKRATSNVCIDFASFVCPECAGIHRKFNHRIKSISIATFTSEDVDKLKNGGNEVCNKKFLAKYKVGKDPFSLPNEGELNKIEQYIKLKYVDKKWFKATVTKKNDDEKNENDSEKKKKKLKSKKSRKSDSDEEEDSENSDKESDDEFIKNNKKNNRTSTKRSSTVKSIENDNNNNINNNKNNKKSSIKSIEVDFLDLPISQPTQNNRQNDNDDWTFGTDTSEKNWEPFEQPKQNQTAQSNNQQPSRDGYNLQQSVVTNSNQTLFVPQQTFWNNNNNIIPISQQQSNAQQNSILSFTQGEEKNTQSNVHKTSNIDVFADLFGTLNVTSTNNNKTDANPQLPTQQPSNRQEPIQQSNIPIPTQYNSMMNHPIPQTNYYFQQPPSQVPVIFSGYNMQYASNVPVNMMYPPMIPYVQSDVATNFVSNFNSYTPVPQNNVSYINQVPQSQSPTNNSFNPFRS